MRVNQEEANRIFHLTQQQGTEIVLDDVEKLDGNRLLLRFQGIVKDDPNVEVPPAQSIAEMMQNGSVRAQVQAPLLPDEVFQLSNEKQSHIERTVQEESAIFKMEKIEYPPEGGIYLYLKGWDDDPTVGIKDGKYNPLKYPSKGLPQVDALSACNLAKRVLICQIKYFAKNPISALPLITKKGLSRWLDENNRIFISILSPFYLAENRYMKCCRALRTFIEVFLKAIGISDPIARGIAQAVVTLIEWDTAYSYRLRDLATVTTKELLLENARREFKKIMEALIDRDPARADLQGKFKAVFTILTWAMFIPKYRRAFNEALNSIDFTMIQADDADKYHMLCMTGYKFGGVPDKERIAEYLRIHDNRPPLRMRVGGASISKNQNV